MSLIRYTGADPFFGIFDDFFPISTQKNLPTFTTNRRVRVQHKDKATEISVAAPGLSKDAFQVNLNGTTLTIEYAAAEGADTFFTREQFSRQWRVDQGTTGEDISAAYENGVLVVTVKRIGCSPSDTTTITIN
jgi:HSP20 family protein